MKRKIILALGLSVVFTNFNAQEIIKKDSIPHPNQKYLDFTADINSVFGKRKTEAKELNQKPPDEYNLQEYLATMDPQTGAIYNQNFVKLEKELEAGRFKSSKSLKMFSGVTAEGKASTEWIERGPYEVAGRIRGIMFDPNDATGKKVWAGGVSGGLWYNNDITSATSEWTLVDSFWANTSISSIVSDPNNPLIFYVGTGEVETNDISGLGIWKTIDGGLTWNQIFNFTGTQSGNVKNGNYNIPVIKVLNNNGVSEVYAGVAGGYLSDAETFMGVNQVGLYKSTDGTNFVRLNSLMVNTLRGYDVQDIEIGSDNSIWVSTRRSYYGENSGGKIFKSTDNGLTFTKVYDVGNINSRVMIEISETNPNKVYGLMQGANSSTEPLRIVKTTDGGSTWISTSVSGSGITLPKPIDVDQPAIDFTRGQSFYDLVVETDPTNDDHLYVGGIDSYKSTNGGATWTQFTKWSNNNQLWYANIPIVHADQHALAFNPKNPNQFIMANDGGMFLANNKNSLTGSSAVVMRNKRLNVTQFYHGTLNPKASFGNEEMLLGAQDNGTQMLYGAPLANQFYSEDEVYGGDGAYTAYDNDDQYFVASYVYNYHYLFKGNTMRPLINAADMGKGQFINPLVVDRNLDIAYTNANGSGSNVIQINKVSGLLNTGAFTSTKFDLLANSANKYISKMFVSPLTTNSSTLLVGLNSGDLYKVTNANTTSPAITKINYTFPGYISDVRIGSSENEILVTVANFNVYSVFYTKDGGVNWSNKEGNLPDIPVKAIFMNPGDDNEVILGTYFGVWGTSNFQSANPTWSLYSNGLGRFKVNHFDYRPSDKTILAVTYGRGAFTTRIENNTLDTNDFKHNTIKNRVFPNPTRGPLYVKFDDSKDKLVDIEVFDASGKKVMSKSKVKSEQELNIGDLPKGNYMIRVSQNGTQIYSSAILKR